MQVPWVSFGSLVVLRTMCRPGVVSRCYIHPIYDNNHQILQKHAIVGVPTIHVENVDELKWFNSSYFPDLR